MDERATKAGVSVLRQLCHPSVPCGREPKQSATPTAVRRGLAVAACGLALALSAPAPANANSGAGQVRHGVSSFGDLKYAADFKHFAYVNPDAPKGGRLITTSPFALNTFDSFNPFILKGDPVFHVAELTFDSLLVRAADEPDGYYGLAAETVELATDLKSVTFKLRAAATFSDGKQVTADDCVFSFKSIKEKGHPNQARMLEDVAAAEALDARTVRYTFKGTAMRNLPVVVGSLPILQKAQFETRAFDQSGLDPMIGSGPYKIGDYKQGAFVAFARRPDYWAKDLPVNRGRWNFDEVRYDYYRQRQIGLEAVKGGLIDIREEFTSKDWATSYDTTAVKEKKLLLETLPDANPSGTQGFWINTRKAKFQDVRVRRALDLLFDFEWTNRNLFYGLYNRTHSFFENSPMKAVGKPSDAELKLLEPFRDKLPKAVFEDVYLPPVSDGTGSDRKLMREASRLLGEAGWQTRQERSESVVRNAKGEALSIEFMINDTSSERLLAPFVKNLKAVGIETTIRVVDTAQYERRRKAFDYDIVTGRFTKSLTPGPELKSYYSSQAAATEGSFNLTGMAHPAIDALLDQIGAATSRADLELTARALDRVLRAGHYWVPQWNKASHTLALWDKFSRPPVKPAFDRGIVDTWWFDPAKAAKLKGN
jgi:microcin C transport system substrate-binding protein